MRLLRLSGILGNDEHTSGNRIMSFIEELARKSGRPPNYFSRPFLEQIRYIEHQDTLDIPAQKVADWIRANRQRFAHLKVERTKCQRKLRYEYELLTAPDDGSLVGIVTGSSEPLSTVGLFMVFCFAFDKLAAEVGMAPRSLREELNTGGYLRRDKNRLTLSLTPTPISKIPPDAGPRARRAVGIRSRLVDDHPPI